MSSFVQKLGGNSNAAGAGQVTATLTASMTPGNSLIAIVMASGGGTFTSVTDNHSNTWTKRKELPNGSTGGIGGCAIYDCLSPTTPLSSGDTVKLIVGGSPSRCGIVIAEYVPLSSPDQSGSNSTTSSVTSGSVTAGGATSTAVEVAIAGIQTVNSSGTMTASGGFTERADDGGAYAHLADDDLAATGTPSASFSWATARAYVAVMQTYTPGTTPAPTAKEKAVLALAGRYGT